MLSQRVYIDTICAHFCLQDVWPVTTPMEAGAQLTDGSSNETQPDYPYKEIVRLLMYATTAMQPDITLETSIFGQFAQAPTKIHWEATK